MSLYDYYTSLLVGVDLERFDFLVPTLVGITIVLCVGLTLKALLSIFNTFLYKR